MKHFWIYLLIMFAVTYGVRVLPFVVFREKIENQFFRSFLTYIPYAVLGAMTVPAVFYATGSILTAAAGAVTAFLFAYRGRGLFEVAVAASLVAFLTALIVN